MKIKFLGAHNAESINTRMLSILIDDILALDAGNLVSDLTFSDQEKINAILLSHGHYDHIRDVPAFAFNNYQNTTNVYGTQETISLITSHLTNGIIYPKFTEKISFFLEKPALNFEIIEPFNPFDMNGYSILALPVNHTIRTVGFEIKKNNKSIFYTSDTGQGLSALWEHVTPQLLIVELTFPDKLEIRAKNSAHLCPKMLRKELREFRRIKGYLPQISLVHLAPKYQNEIKKEIKELSKYFNHPISIAEEGMEIVVQGDIIETNEIT
jgi:ribonuclease BN (tRNA processing enzyme)